MMPRNDNNDFGNGIPSKPEFEEDQDEYTLPCSYQEVNFLYSRYGQKREV